MIALALLLISFTATPAQSSQDFNAGSRQEIVVVNGYDETLNSDQTRGNERDGSRNISPQGNRAKPTIQFPTTRTERTSGCHALISSTTNCAEALEQARNLCPDTFIQVDQTVRVFDLESGEQISIEYIPGFCSENNQVVTVIAEDFKTLTLDSSALNIEPHNLTGYVNLPVFVHTTAKPQQLTTQVLGTDVLVKATPTSFTFTYGDTTPPHTTTKPGAPYPDKTNAHTYRKPGTYTITLETTWSGQFSVNHGQTWLDIDGANTTKTPPQTITIRESTPLLTG